MNYVFCSPGAAPVFTDSDSACVSSGIDIIDRGVDIGLSKDKTGPLISLAQGLT